MKIKILALLVLLVLLITSIATATSAFGQEKWTGVKIITSPLGPGSTVQRGTNRVIHAFRILVGDQPWEFTEVDLEFETSEKGGSELSLPWSLPNLKLTDIAGQNIPIELSVVRFDSGKATVKLRDLPYQAYAVKDFMVVADPDGGWATGDRITVTTTEVRGRPVGTVPIQSIITVPPVKTERTVQGYGTRVVLNRVDDVVVQGRSGKAFNFSIVGLGGSRIRLQASNDMNSWSDLGNGNSTVPEGGNLNLGISYDESHALWKLFREGKVFFRIKTEVPPLFRCPDGSIPVIDPKTGVPLCP